MADARNRFHHRHDNRGTQYAQHEPRPALALRRSYFFLCCSPSSFLMPPIYMFITSLKTSAEISAATIRGGSIRRPFKYLELLTQNSIHFSATRRSVGVRRRDHHADQRQFLRFALARMNVRAPPPPTGVFLTPDPGNELLLHPAVQDVRVGQRDVRHPADESLVDVDDPVPTAPVPFATWIMIATSPRSPEPTRRR